MNVVTVARELAAHLAVVVPRTSIGQPDSVTDPCAVVPLPTEITFDEVYSRGQDMIEWDILVITSKTDDRGALARIGEYCAGSGPRSIKQALEGGAPYTACGDVHVSSVELNGVTWQGTDFQGAFFTVEIHGNGLS